MWSIATRQASEGPVLGYEATREAAYEDKIVGRIMFSAPSVDPWAWMLTYGHHEDRSPIDGYEPSRDAAMQAFASSWHREK